MRTPQRILGIAIGASAFLCAPPSPAIACSVCFGDPDSSMAKGAIAGVIVLVGVVTVVLMGVAGTRLYWIHRSRRLALGEDAVQGSER